MHDLRFALRQLTKSPGFTAAVVISLALGIGANAAVWCWLRSLVLRPLPGVSQQEEIVVLVSESLLLALLGGLAGLLIATWAIDAIPLFVPAKLPPSVMLDYSLDAATVGFALVLTLSCGLAFGLAPAWQAA